MKDKLPSWREGSDAGVKKRGTVSDKVVILKEGLAGKAEEKQKTSTKGKASTALEGYGRREREGSVW